MTWETPVPIFEDEDEAELIARFVELSAAHPKEPAIAITNFIFENLRDPIGRAGQAALNWSTNLGIRERIRQAKANGGKELKPIETKEDKLRKIEAIYNDTDIPTKDRLAAMRLHAEIMGEIVKAVDKDNDNKDRPHFPQIVFAVAEQRAA